MAKSWNARKTVAKRHFNRKAQREISVLTLNEKHGLDRVTKGKAQGSPVSTPSNYFRVLNNYRMGV